MTRYCPSCGADYVDTATMCVDCRVPLTSEGATPLTGHESDHDLLVYELDQWEPDRRRQLEVQLGAAGVPYEWEGTDLIVPSAQEATVDELLDAVEFPDALPSEEEEADDEAVYQVMSDLFVVADRIASAQKVDLAVAGDFIEAAGAAAQTPAPFGFDERTWQEVQRQATRISEQLEGEDDDDVVIASARTLSDALRGFV